MLSINVPLWSDDVVKARYPNRYMRYPFGEGRLHHRVLWNLFHLPGIYIIATVSQLISIFLATKGGTPIWVDHGRVIFSADQTGNSISGGETGLTEAMARMALSLYHGDAFLCWGAGGSCGSVWSIGNIQHGSKIAMYGHVLSPLGWKNTGSKYQWMEKAGGGIPCWSRRFDWIWII